MSARVPVVIDADAAGMVYGGFDVDDDLALLAALSSHAHRRIDLVRDACRCAQSQPHSLTSAARP